MHTSIGNEMFSIIASFAVPECHYTGAPWSWFKGTRKPLNEITDSCFSLNERCFQNYRSGANYHYQQILV